jgi:glycine/D-amino acid oxidase-like deaminating enzyme
MVEFTNRSIDLMEEISRESDNKINMSRRGYALVTRSTEIDEIDSQLREGLGGSAALHLRYHDMPDAPNYKLAEKVDWKRPLSGVDILQNQQLIRDTFPSFAHDVKTVIHIRRGGDISGQQLGSYMLDFLKKNGAKRIVGVVKKICKGFLYDLELSTKDGVKILKAEKIVNAAGPFADQIAKMLGIELPLHNILQQKIMFKDNKKAIPREMPFAIDLDGQKIDWTDEEREMILENSKFQWLAKDMPGFAHCRPEGGVSVSWIKLGWAFNKKRAVACWKPMLEDNFPDIVLRGVARLNPGLRAYYNRLPRAMHHYGGWYTMTEENWPLIGPMGPEGAFMNCALSGFGTMASCAGGELCAAWVVGAELPSYAKGFSLERYEDEALTNSLLVGTKGVL